MTETRLKTPPGPSAPPQEPVEQPLRADRPTFIIRPAPRWPHLDVRELWHYREVLGTIVWRDVVVRYKQTFLGVAWALLVPALSSIVYILVFGKFAKFPAGNTAYPSLVVAGVIPMQYFSSSVTNSSLSLVTNLPLVTKVYFPRVLLPFAAVLAPVIDLLVALPVLLVLMAVYGTWPAGAQVVFAPLFLALALFTALGIGFLLSAANVRYRDVRYMIPVFLQILPLLSGVMYEVNQLPGKWQWILSVNPMTGVISGWRWAVLGASEPNWLQMLVGVGSCAALFVIGLTVFRISEPRFADTI
ncbi:MAG: lipopolysaccharide transport system permease protein [Gaiellaceae bacterium]|nr:lipopolysaccharide transport system permease protein [Gaiellaceae bacterium]